MKAKALLLIVSLACAPTVYTFGQVDCTTSTKLVCQLPGTAAGFENISSGATSAFNNAVLGSYLPINSSVAAQLTQLPIPSASVGVVSIHQKGSDVPVPFENLGPILTDRPDTVGRGRLFAGFSYQHFNFNAVDGVNLDSLPVGFTFSQPASNDKTDIQTFFGTEINKVSFQLDQYVGLVTYGLTKTTDVSVVVPINSVSLAVVSSNLNLYLYDSKSQQYVNESPAATTRIPTSGSASGVGDVTLSLKQLVIGGEGSRPAIAAGASLRLPSGDALNYLGSGAYGGNAYGLFEYRARVAPHLKLSYQWNNSSQVMNLQAPPNTQLPGGLQYDAGADFKVVRQLTLAGDFLGNQFVNTPSFKLSPLALNPAPTAANGGSGLAPLPNSVQAPVGGSLNPNTYTTVNVSMGLKVNIRHFLFYGNVLMQLNNVGVRSDPVPLAGIAYNFKTRK